MSPHRQALVSCIRNVGMVLDCQAIELDGLMIDGDQAAIDLNKAASAAYRDTLTLLRNELDSADRAAVSK